MNRAGTGSRPLGGRPRSSEDRGEGLTGHPGGEKKSAGNSGRRLSHGIVILYEDRDILVIDKPAGLLSIAAGAERDKTAHWILSEYLRKKGDKRRAAVVHRLDRETSGIMLFAKSEIIKRRLMENWDTLVSTRRYAALAEGELSEAEGIIDAPLGEDRSSRMTVVPGGMRAVTRWKRIRIGGGYTLLSLELETGRRNQIRAHLSHIGRPVAGDKKYRAKTDPIGRLCLHAESLVFRHPGSGKLLDFTVPVPESFMKVLKKTLSLPPKVCYGDFHERDGRGVPVCPVRTRDNHTSRSPLKK